MDPLELERLIDRELRETPAPRAPETLLPRVMQAVRGAESVPAAAVTPLLRPATGWRSWPVAGQIAAFVGVVLLVMGLANLLPLIYQVIDASLANPAAGSTGARLAGVLQQLEAAASAARVIWRVIGPVVVFVCTLVTVMAVACALFGSALGRVVSLEGASRS